MKNERLISEWKLLYNQTMDLYRKQQNKYSKKRFFEIKEIQGKMEVIEKITGKINTPRQPLFMRGSMDIKGS